MRRDGPREQQNQNDIAKKQQQKEYKKICTNTHTHTHKERERECMIQNYRLHCGPYLTLKDENKIIPSRKL